MSTAKENADFFKKELNPFLIQKLLDFGFKKIQDKLPVKLCDYYELKKNEDCLIVLSYSLEPYRLNEYVSFACSLKFPKITPRIILGEPDNGGYSGWTLFKDKDARVQEFLIPIVSFVSELGPTDLKSKDEIISEFDNSFFKDLEEIINQMDSFEGITRLLTERALSFDFDIPMIQYGFFHILYGDREVGIRFLQSLPERYVDQYKKTIESAQSNEYYREHQKNDEINHAIKLLESNKKEYMTVVRAFAEKYKVEGLKFDN